MFSAKQIVYTWTLKICGNRLNAEFRIFFPVQCFFNWSQIKREKPGDKAGKHPQFLRYWRMRTETLVSEMTSGSWFFQKDCTLQMLVVQSFESLLKFPCYSQRYFSLLGWQLCANLNLNMLITFKTLQQQTFKLEIDDTATLGTKINKSEGSFDLHLYSLWIRVSSLSFNHQILHRATKEHRLSFISCNVFVCVCKIMRGFFT